MQSLGRKTHKSLIKINKSTILESIVSKLEKFGIKDHIVTVGYRKNDIKKKLKNFKNSNFEFVYVKDFKKKGSSFSLYTASKFSKKFSKILMIHADIIFDPHFLKKIIYSKHENVIGYVKKNKKKIKDNGYLIEFNKKKIIKRIDRKYYYKNPKNYEIICINKFSNKMFFKFNRFLKYYLNTKTDDQTWEIPLNYFIKHKKPNIYTEGLSYKTWFNINTTADLKEAKNYFK